MEHQSLSKVRRVSLLGRASKELIWMREMPAWWGQEVGLEGTVEATLE